MSAMEDDRYPMSNPRRGQFIIINNETFDAMPKRSGTDVDAVELTKIFRDKLGFAVAVHKDKKAHEMQSLVREAIEREDKETSECDCFGVAILTHGTDNGRICGIDGEIEIDKLVEPVKKCKKLFGKPKIFFFQACRGEKLDSGMAKDGGAMSPPTRLPMESDCLYAYSTPPGYFAWRNQIEGSWFIQSLCEKLDELAFEMDLVRILTRVNRLVAEQYSSHCPKKAPSRHDKKQSPSYASMLTRELQFTPRKTG